MQDEITPHKAKYLEYLQSPEWQEKRLRALERAGHRCQLCSGRRSLQVHHNSYANLYREAPQDLTVLCDPCHRKHHDIGERKDSPRRKAKSSRPAPLKKAYPSLPVPCPECGAPSGKPCKRSYGNLRKKPHVARVRAAGKNPYEKREAAWRRNVIAYLSTSPGATSVQVAQRLQISRSKAEGRLALLAEEGSAVKIDIGWCAVGLEGQAIQRPMSPTWVPKAA